MKRVIFCMSLLTAGAFASAATVILNPGDVNNLGVPLTCEYSGGGGSVNPPPPPPPRLVGYYNSVPDMRCLQGAPKSDPRTIDNYISGCGFRNDQNMFCDSTQIQSTREEGGCFSMLYAKETEPTVIHPDQMQDLHDVCTITTYACYVNQ